MAFGLNSAQLIGRLGADVTVNDFCAVQSETHLRAPSRASSDDG